MNRCVQNFDRYYMSQRPSSELWLIRREVWLCSNWTVLTRHQPVRWACARCSGLENLADTRSGSVCIRKSHTIFLQGPAVTSLLTVTFSFSRPFFFFQSQREMSIPLRSIAPCLCFQVNIAWFFCSSAYRIWGTTCFQSWIEYSLSLSCRSHFCTFLVCCFTTGLVEGT